MVQEKPPVRPVCSVVSVPKPPDQPNLDTGTMACVQRERAKGGKKGRKIKPILN